MQTIQTEVLVIGGGATGAGVVRDLAMRGFKTILVEKADFAHGTTGRYHGLLHSGGRYAVKDPSAAKECIEENRILRRIMPHCIEDTGGFFVLTPHDDPSFATFFLQGCQTAGIPVEEISIETMLKEEPLLNPQISRCFRVPDGSADSFLGAHLNVESAKNHGAQVLNYHKVKSLLKSGDKVEGVICINVISAEEVKILANMVVNASGAWAGQIAAMAGAHVQITPGKGTMIAMNHRIVNTVINRCKQPSDGDILVPAHTVSIIGTTDIKVNDPDRFPIEPWEIQLLLEEGNIIVPGFKSMRMLRAWAGVRPLYQETQVGGNRDVTRAFALLDHQSRDGISGFITITSGKWTTYRKMAEVTVDLVCQKLGVNRSCRTHLEPLPAAGHQGYHELGARLSKIEKSASFGKVICECELATQSDVIEAIERGDAKSLDDIRRDIRLGMGPCQGGFCTLRAAGLMHQLNHPPVEETNVALRDFLHERWKGLLPILWGQQMRQERLDELIYRSLLNIESLPGPKNSPITPVTYERSSSGEKKKESKFHDKPSIERTASGKLNQNNYLKTDVLVIGAGLAGLIAGWQLSKSGLRTHVIAKGWGATHWHTGCIDILGREPFGNYDNVTSPVESLPKLIKVNPAHPYALSGIELIDKAVSSFITLFAENNYPFHGSLLNNMLLPSAVGTLRPTCLAPETMINGDFSHFNSRQSCLLVGFSQFIDFYAEFAAENLKKLGYNVKAITLDLQGLRSLNFVTGRVIAEKLDRSELITEIAQALRTHLDNVTVIGFPAVLGLQNFMQVKSRLENELRLPIFEIPTLPPSIPGMRMQRILVKAIEKYGGRVTEGLQVIDAQSLNHHVSHVMSEAASRQKIHTSNTFVLATGGFLGGGYTTNSDGFAQDSVFSLDLCSPQDHANWFEDDFLAASGHPIYKFGIPVNAHFQPVQNGNPIFSNLFIAGCSLPYFDPLQERSLEGVALSSAFAVSNIIINQQL